MKGHVELSHLCLLLAAVVAGNIMNYLSILEVREVAESYKAKISVLAEVHSFWGLWGRALPSNTFPCFWRIPTIHLATSF